MITHFITIFFLTSFKSQFPTKADSKFPSRRILHQPLFPASSSPPPPPPETPDFPDEGQPFGNELPAGTPTTPYQSQPQPPPFPTVGTAVVANPVRTHPPPNPAKRIAVVASSVILTLGMLSAMAFYLYKHRQTHSSDGARKPFDESPQRIVNEESRLPPSSLLRNTAEPSAGSLANVANVAAQSPFRKLNSPRGSVLRPLTKPPPPPASLKYSPPPMSSSSSDDESQDNGFSHTPPARPDNRVSCSTPHSKRTSPRSRFSPSPPIKQSPPPAISLSPLQPSRTLKYSPKRTKCSPPPGMERRRSVSNNELQASQIPIPQPPPPPPLRLSMTRSSWATKTATSQKIRTPSKSPIASPVKAEIKNASCFVDAASKNGSRPQMKPLHWDKVGPTPDSGTVWEQLKSSSFHLNEDAMDSLFGRKSGKSEATKKLVFPSLDHKNRILDSKKSQNIAILLRALNVTREEVCEALLDGNPEGLDPELFETLVKMAPSKEEEIRLLKCEEGSSKLGPAERFLRAILEIPFAFQRVEVMLYRANFGAEVEYLRKSFQTLEEASEQLKNSQLFLKLLEGVLRTGNRMNDGTNRGSAKAFKLDTLLKLVDIKGTDGKTSLLHFVVQEIIRSEGPQNSLKNDPNKHRDEDDFKRRGFQIVSGLSRELGDVKRAAGMDFDVLSGYVSKLETGLQKVKRIFQNEKSEETTAVAEKRFFDSMRAFLKDASDEICKVRAEERKAVSLVREVTRYFHGEHARQEGRPLGIFVIVRDFLLVLDNVCKDVGRRMLDGRSTSGGERSFRISAGAASFPVVGSGRYDVANYGSSDEDSM